MQYIFSKENIYITLLAKDIQIALPSEMFSVKISDDCIIDFDNTLSASDETILNNTVTTHKNAYSALLLTNNKLAKNAKINARTQELIALGFTYMGSQLSLSVFAQSNAHAFQIGAIKGWGGFPKAISTLDDGELLLNNAGELDGYYTTGLNVAKGHYDSGRALKLLVNNATTQAELDAVVDNR